MSHPKSLERPVAKERHPLTNRTYRVATTAIESCWLLVAKCLQFRIPGALIYGESRLGKTYAIEYRMLIHRERPEIPTFCVETNARQFCLQEIFADPWTFLFKSPRPQHQIQNSRLPRSSISL